MLCLSLFTNGDAFIPANRRLWRGGTAPVLETPGSSRHIPALERTAWRWHVWNALLGAKRPAGQSRGRRGAPHLNNLTSAQRPSHCHDRRNSFACPGGTENSQNQLNSPGLLDRVLSNMRIGAPILNFSELVHVAGVLAKKRGGRGETSHGSGGRRLTVSPTWLEASLCNVSLHVLWQHGRTLSVCEVQT